jgi:hypothetical protein
MRVHDAPAGACRWLPWRAGKRRVVRGVVAGMQRWCGSEVCPLLSVEEARHVPLSTLGVLPAGGRFAYGSRERSHSGQALY